MFTCVRLQGLDFIADFFGFGLGVFAFLDGCGLGLSNLVHNVSSESALDLVPLLETVLSNDTCHVVEFFPAIDGFLGFIVGGVASLFQIAS